MADDRILDLERRWAASRSAEDAEALLRERLRRGHYDMRSIVGELIRLRRLVEVLLSTAYAGPVRYSARGDVPASPRARIDGIGVYGPGSDEIMRMLSYSLAPPSAADILAVMNGRMGSVETRWSPPGTVTVPSPGAVSDRPRRESLYDTVPGGPCPPPGSPPAVFPVGERTGQRADWMQPVFVDAPPVGPDVVGGESEDLQRMRDELAMERAEARELERRLETILERHRVRDEGDDDDGSDPGYYGVV